MCVMLVQGVREDQDLWTGPVRLPTFSPLLSTQEVQGDAPLQSQTTSVRCRDFMAGDDGAQAG